MGQSRAKKKRFFETHPMCCFCGGQEFATTIDHIPPRSLFIDRRFPKGMEFPACGKCQNQSTDHEDTTRLILLAQGGAINPKVDRWIASNQSKYARGAKQRNPSLTGTGDEIRGMPIVQIGDKEQESLIEFHRKLFLALYYKVTKAALGAERRISMTFFDSSKAHLVSAQLASLESGPLDDSMLEVNLAEQFTYRYSRFSALKTPFDIYMGSFIHGLAAFATFFFSDEDATGSYRNILRSPLTHEDPQQ